MPTVCQPRELWGRFNKTVKKQCSPQCLAHSKALACTASLGSLRVCSKRPWHGSAGRLAWGLEESEAARPQLSLCR